MELKIINEPQPLITALAEFRDGLAETVRLPALARSASTTFYGEDVWNILLQPEQDRWLLTAGVLAEIILTSFLGRLNPGAPIPTLVEEGIAA